MNDYRIQLAGTRTKVTSSFMKAYAIAQKLADEQALEIAIEKDFGVCGWQVCETVRPRERSR